MMNVHRINDTVPAIFLSCTCTFTTECGEKGSVKSSDSIQMSVLVVCHLQANVVYLTR